MKKFCFITAICVVLILVMCLSACDDKAKTIRFDPNYEGAEVIEVVVQAGELGVVPDATREGYTLEGWYLDREGTQSVGLVVGGTVVASDNTYYAKWQAVTDAAAGSQEGDSSPTGASGDTDPGQQGGTTDPTQGEGEGSSDGASPTGEGGQSTVTLVSISATYTGTVKAGAAFDREAITVTAAYSDGSSGAITDYTLAYSHAAMNEVRSVAVRYRDKECSMAYQVSVPEVVTPSVDNNIYFTNNQNWASVYAYAWTGDGEGAVKNAPWPGEACTYVATNEYGQAVYAYDLTGKSFAKIIFNNNNQGEQTVDITLSDATNGYYTTDKQEGKYNVNPYQDKYVQVQLGTVTTHEFTGLGNWTKDGKKKVYIYTPAGYDSTDTDKRYRVLYMFDGQNLFDGLSLDNGSAVRWGVNTTLARAYANCIVVGIDNGDEYRDRQLTMDEATFGTLSELTRAGGVDETANYQHGTLDILGDFIRDTLIPYINRHYQVFTGREDTYIAGSSSGGLAAFYLGLRDHDLYGAVGAFSPATGLFDLSTWQTWLSGEARVAAGAYPQAMFIYCGHGAGSDDLENALYAYGETAGASTLQALLADAGYTDLGRITTLFTVGAGHAEGAWREAFKSFVDFVY